MGNAGTASSGNDNASATPEVLVTIGGLAGATNTTGLRAPTVTDMRFVIGTTAATDLTAGSSSQTITVEITYDEQVTVVGTASPTVSVANGNQGTGAQTLEGPIHIGLHCNRFYCKQT